MEQFALEEVFTPKRRVSGSPRWVFAVSGLALLAVGGVIGVIIGRHDSSMPMAPETPIMRASTQARTLLAQRLQFDVERHSFISRVDARVLIPGIGNPILNGTLIFDDTNNILFVGSKDSIPDTFVINQTYTVDTVMPGLWDCHTHFGGSVPTGTPFKMDDEYPLNMMRFNSAIQELRETLMMGITSVREVGGAYGQALHEAIRTGQVVGPNFHFAGRALGVTGGHTDSQTVPLELYRQYMTRNKAGGALCDGVSECLKRARENLRMQADVIKIMATGGVLSEFDEPTDTEFTLEEVKAIVEDAKRARRAVAAHVHGSGGIQQAIDGGVTTIEHGSYMTEHQADEIIKHKDYMVYVPTVLIAQLFNGTRPPFLDDNQWRKGVDVLNHHTASVKRAIKKGVPIVTGTDCPHRCAEVGKEVGLLNMFGMTPLNAIQAATGDAPRCMGQYGMMPKSGRLEEGYEADVIALNANPLEDLTALTRDGNITHVWKAGELVKSPGSGVAKLGLSREATQADGTEEGRIADLAAMLPW